MSDQDRIQKLLKDGKITQEEASNLLEALAEAEAAERSVHELEAEVREASNTEKKSSDEIREAAPKTLKTKKKIINRASSGKDLPKDLNWVYITTLFGDVEVRVDESLDEPVVEGKAQIEKRGDDFYIRQANTQRKRKHKEGLEGFVEGVSEVVTGFVSRLGGELDLRLPKGFGLVLDSKAGDVEIRDVPYLKANMLAGDVEAKNLKGIDLIMGAGDVDVSLYLSEGKHRIRLGAGDIDVVLKEPNVALKGSVSVGDFTFRGPSKIRDKIQIEERMLGGSFSGQIDQGSASLSIQLSTGDLELTVDE